MINRGIPAGLCCLFRLRPQDRWNRDRQFELVGEVCDRESKYYKFTTEKGNIFAFLDILKK